jgi:hypothetical protein
MTEVVYDTGVLVAAERRDRHVWTRHRRALQAGRAPMVPAPVLAQVWRGGPQPLLSRFLGGCQVMPMDEALARAAGSACGRAGMSDVVDATVAVAARTVGAAVLTGDGDDIERLVAAAGGGVVERI